MQIMLDFLVQTWYYIHVNKNSHKKGNKKMARKRMVTRNIMVSTVTVLCVDLDTAQTVVKEFTWLGKGQYTRQGLLADLQAKHETDSLKLVQVQKVVSEEKRYGMTEEDFLALAQPID